MDHRHGSRAPSDQAGQLGFVDIHGVGTNVGKDDFRAAQGEGVGD